MHNLLTETYINTVSISGKTSENQGKTQENAGNFEMDSLWVPCNNLIDTFVYGLLGCLLQLLQEHGDSEVTTNQTPPFWLSL